ncbi:predicted protein [Uncinocarpus reesii 1704]|uniref:Uncharacterized protein n=1 Tax=Uncinocarpus reesii (strain UAMH 1704) TaxID=336963 RepID=C4JDG8_UNCRE|nr:uncharacterized protein UREG_00386 [Uncinocarpus reesii 1704]EEP75540.1 predicted protein [Uncinocarpus reesii 1704]
MVGLKKFLNAEKIQSRLCSPDSADLGCYSPSRGVHFFKIFTEAHPPKICQPSLLKMENQTFLGIDRQFEDLHDHFRSRPEKRYHYIDPKRCPLRTKHHIDVLEAIFPPQNYPSTPVSPLTLYNEDIAERNITTPPIQVQDPYARVISAIYQEDVADRNIIRNGGSLACDASRYHLRVQKTRPQVRETKEGRTRTRSQSPASNRKSFVDNGGGNLRTSTSEHGLRKYSSAAIENEASKFDKTKITTESSNGSRPATGTTHANSTSALNTKMNDAYDKLASAGSGGRRAPKSSRLKSGPRAAGEKVPQPQCNLLLFPKPCTFSTRKNVRDLSINMELAAPRKMFVKVGTRSVETSSPKSQRNPSIAEVVNGPASIPNPATHKLNEIINLLKQACSPRLTEPSTATETLQDAIVREINSHDAFHRINSDGSFDACAEISPVLIVEHSQEQVPRHKAPSTNFSRKGKYETRYFQKTSSKETERSPTTPGRELSIPALMDLERDATYRFERQRRHTYAQPSSTLLNECESDIRKKSLSP